jgi:hypothetical protein
MFFPTANWYMSVPTTSAHAPSSTDVEPRTFGRVLHQMRTPGVGPNLGPPADSQPLSSHPQANTLSVARIATFTTRVSAHDRVNHT